MGRLYLVVNVPYVFFTTPTEVDHNLQSVNFEDVKLCLSGGVSRKSVSYLWDTPLVQVNVLNLCFEQPTGEIKTIFLYKLFFLMYF